MSDRLDDIKKQREAATQGPWWVMDTSAPHMDGCRPEIPTFKVMMALDDGRLNTGPGYTRATAAFIADAPWNTDYLTTFADLVLEELGKHVVGGSDDGEPWCAECVGQYPCQDAELLERLEAL